MPHLRRSGSRGDLHVFIRVVVPHRLSKEQRRALEAYADASGESVGPPGGLMDRVRDALG